MVCTLYAFFVMSRFLEGWTFFSYIPFIPIWFLCHPTGDNPAFQPFPLSAKGDQMKACGLTILNFSSFFATLKPPWLRLFITRFLKQCIKIRYSYSCTWNAFYFIDTRLELTIEFEESLYWKLNINLRIKHDTISVKN